MGWNTWNTFEKDISEKLILESVDAMVESGLKDAGYEYVVIDDIWSLKERDENGRLVPDPEKFPHGMKYVADYIHSKGLKFGMYSCAGYLTCGGYPGSYEHEWIDAKTFAEWGVDYLKYDFCFHSSVVANDILYKRMGLALANCGREILFSACSWGTGGTKHWVSETGASMWRSTYDIKDSWVSVRDLAVRRVKGLEFGGTGCFNDMDMLIVGMEGKGFVGMGGCTEDEYFLHFALWSLCSSPLMIGCDIRNMSESAKSIMMNKALIEINQDVKGCTPFLANNMPHNPRQNRGEFDCYWDYCPEENPIIARFLDNGDIAVGFFNLSDANLPEERCTVFYDMLGLPATSGATLEFTDVRTGVTYKSANGVFCPDYLPAHSCRVYRARVIKN